MTENHTVTPQLCMKKLYTFLPCDKKWYVYRPPYHIWHVGDANQLLLFVQIDGKDTWNIAYKPVKIAVPLYLQ